MLPDLQTAFRACTQDSTTHAKISPPESLVILVCSLTGRSIEKKEI